jgi:hypothetical protein
LSTGGISRFDIPVNDTPGVDIRFCSAAADRVIPAIPPPYLPLRIF